MSDLGDLHFFLRIVVRRTMDELFLTQRQYVVDLLQHAGMFECHSSLTPVDTSAKLSATDGYLLSDATEY
jgi:hypothetical protein